MDQTNVLIVDDEIGPRESLRMILKPDYQVYTAENGYKAVDIIEKNPIDLVTLDLRMPGLKGTDVLRAIKKQNADIEVIVVTGFGTLQSAIDCIRWGVFDYITKPFNVVEIMSVIKKAVGRRVMNVQLNKLLENVKNLGDEKNFDFAKNTLNANKELIKKIKDTIAMESADGASGNIEFLEFIKVLSCTLESKDPYTHGHSRRVSYYSDLIAQRLPFSKDERKDLQVATFLHDIGKVGISNQYIFKETTLTDEEWKLVKEHPEKGVELVKPLNVSSFITSIILYHHEKMDGAGYPEGIKGEDIPVPARVVALSDAYDAMTTDRPYRVALSREEVIRELRVNSGTQFDPKLVEIFLEILEDGELKGLS